MQIPIFDELRAVLDASPTGDMTYLVTAHGRPYTRESFGNWFGDAVRAAGLSGISLHGLRKRFAADQAESQSTTKEIMALGGWDNIQQVELYTKSAERKKMTKNVQARRKKVQK
jgi:integrase